MSEPAQERHRKRKGKRPKGKGRIAQMDHANAGEAEKRRREYGRKDKKDRKGKARREGTA
jgi:hypothetical protein